MIVCFSTDGVIERTVGEYYAIQEQIEMGQMAKLFYSTGWLVTGHMNITSDD